MERMLADRKPARAWPVGVACGDAELSAAERLQRGHEARERWINVFEWRPPFRHDCCISRHNRHSSPSVARLKLLPDSSRFLAHLCHHCVTGWDQEIIWDRRKECRAADELGSAAH